MREVGLSDLDMAARALMAMPERDWDRAAASMITGAHVADLWRKRHGVAHPAGGTGSLYAQAALAPRMSSSRCAPAYCRALMAVLCALEAWRARDHREM